MTERHKIGWIGLGKMGAPMSENLIKKGYKLIVYDIAKENVDKLIAMGALSADSLEDIGRTSDVIISMIPNDRVLDEISIQPGGVFETLKPGAIFIDMSTVSPSASARVDRVAKQKDIKYLRAPVSGSTLLAKEAKLTIFVSGPNDAYKNCLKIFESMGQKSFYVGDNEQARFLKLVINIMVGLTAAITAEALTFGQKGDMDWKQMIDIVSNSVVASPLIIYKAQALKDHDFSAAFTANQMAKDFNIILDTGRDMGLNLPMVSMVYQYLADMKHLDKGDLDFFGLITLWEEMNSINR